MNGGSGKIRTLISQILLVIVLFAVAFILLRRANLIQLPTFLENLFYKEQTEVTTETNDNREIFNHIGSYTDINEIKSYPSISVSNMNSLLESLVPHENFYWESTTEVYSNNSVSTRVCKSRISGNKYNAEITDNSGTVLKKYVSDGVSTRVSSMKSDKSSSNIYKKGVFDFYSDAGLISVEHFKGFEFTDDNCEIKHIKNNDYNIISVEYRYERNGIAVKNIYGISLDYGVVLFAECYENDVRVFNQTTNSIYPLTSLEGKLFTVN